ncbi:GatB/YqeY domain-containing protein [Lentithecium fluviatile CBS 122367]|uniref:Altered inheritance of mitochondria protein 41 n=1 Tax=Lentithecium fluviatile CBS 122367 TaxID=1168545 RepID=A0A6G1J1F5_9PLEO|nr:GatB/YqeY domain-containing protein [Lentithecium fluviatile CBS 122367]
MSLLRLHLTRSTFATPRPLVRTFLTTPRLSTDSTPRQDATTTITSLQSELKTAMRAKDKPRLTTLRSLLAEITNASKTAKTIENDSHLYLLLTRQIKASKTALEEFEKAKRVDLMEKEKAQLIVLEELKGRIAVLGEDEIESTVRAVLKGLQEANQKQGKAKGGFDVGAVVGRTMGRLSGPVDVEVVHRKATEIIGQIE